MGSWSYFEFKYLCWEVYDANKEIEGWAEAETVFDGWKHACIASGIIPKRLDPQLVEPIRMQETIKPVKLWQTPSGSWIFDFGVNVAGFRYWKLSSHKVRDLR